VLDAETGDVLQEVSEPGAEDGQLYQPKALALDEAGRLAAVADMFNNRVQFILLDDETLAEQLTGPRSLLAGLIGDRGGCVCLVPFGILALLLLSGYVATRRQGIGSASEEGLGAGTDDGDTGPTIVDFDR
jgi:hypothetical protein